MCPFSYKLWAACIVRRAVKPNLRLASCCNVLVVNGGEGRETYGFTSTDVTRKSALRSFCANSPRRLLVQQQQRRIFQLARRRIEIFSLRESARRRRHQRRPRIACPPALANVASRSQYVAEWNAIRCRSRSTINRTATLCTRPAESLGRTLRHNSGDTS